MNIEEPQEPQEPQANTLPSSTTDQLASRRRYQAAPGSYLNWKRLSVTGKSTRTTAAVRRAFKAPRTVTVAAAASTAHAVPWAIHSGDSTLDHSATKAADASRSASWPSRCPELLGEESTVDGQGVTGDHPRSLRSQEDDGVGDVGGLG